MFMRLNNKIYNLDHLIRSEFYERTETRVAKGAFWFRDSPVVELTGDEATEFFALLCNSTDKQIGRDVSLYKEADLPPRPGPGPNFLEAVRLGQPKGGLTKPLGDTETKPAEWMCGIALLDQGDSLHTLRGRVRSQMRCVELYLEGYGDKTSLEGGCPVILELLDGKPRLVVWGDINQEEPTSIIDLSGAAESLRKE